MHFFDCYLFRLSAPWLVAAFALAPSFPHRDTAQQRDSSLGIAMDQCQITGGAFAATRRQGGWELGVTSSETKGQWTAELLVDLNAYPYLAFQVPELSRECAWSLVVFETKALQRHILQLDAPSFGQYSFDLRAIPGWTGRKRFRLEFTVRGPAGRSNAILLKELGLYRSSPFGSTASNDAKSQIVQRAERMNRALVNANPQSVSLSLMNAPGAEWQWGGATTKVMVDTDLLPFVEMNVRQLSPNASFRLGVGSMTSGPVDRDAGVVSFNYKDASHWQGVHEVPIQMILSGAGGRMVYDPIRFLPYPSLSTPLVAKAEAAMPERVMPDTELATGPYRLAYEAKNGLFRIRRMDGTASLATRFLEMEGVTLAPGAVTKSKTDSGEKIDFQCMSGGVQFKVEAETFAGAEGLLHWRVTAIPRSSAHLSSCGHEICYVPAADSGLGLRRISNQSWSASGLAHVATPGLGTALYFQNYTALNPLFERCHTSPRFWVSASAKTFGFPNPLDTRVTFPEDVPVVLSDAWLYLTPESPAEKPDNLLDASRFLQGLAAIYAQLPDKPATEWRDWPKLARKSLQDLYNGECWASWENGIYLKAYVGTVGSSPQLTGMQDVIGPLLAFLNQTGEGRDMYNRLRAEIPHFWSEKRGSILLFANDPNSNWWSIEQMIGVCRAALNGDAEAKGFCLKSAAAMIRLAQDSSYGFQRFTEFKDLTMNEKEFTGAFLLYMMQLYELSGDVKLVEEAKKAAAQIASWDYSTAKLAAFDGMTCEGLARLYEVTKDKQYLELSQIPLAGLLRNAWLWQCTYGHAKEYTTFFGFNSDASGVDYITAADQHQVWYSLYQYYSRAHSVLSPASNYLVAEAIRHVPQVAWYTYPPNLPAESLHEGVPFWHSKNIFELAVPVEDLNDGWRKNGSVGQELYGAGAAFEFASKGYIRVPDAGVLVFCEYPILMTGWNAARKALAVQIGGPPGQTIKCEIRLDSTSPKGALAGKDATWNISITLSSEPSKTQTTQATLDEGKLRLNVPSASLIEIGLMPQSR